MERLCCRVLWVAEAVARYADQYTPGKNNIPYDRFMRACQMAKGMADEYELTWRRFWDDLDKLRSKLQVSLIPRCLQCKAVILNTLTCIFTQFSSSSFHILETNCNNSLPPTNPA